MERAIMSVAVMAATMAAGEYVSQEAGKEGMVGTIGTFHNKYWPAELGAGMILPLPWVVRSFFIGAGVQAGAHLIADKIRTYRLNKASKAVEPTSREASVI